MRFFLILFALILLVMARAATIIGTDETNAVAGKPTAPPAVSTETPRVYPIAPGVWYPGQPMPEKPIRYYRVRCWPGCHRGSSHGKYPNEPLNMKPIFPTSTIDRGPAVPTESN